MCVFNQFPESGREGFLQGIETVVYNAETVTLGEDLGVAFVDAEGDVAVFEALGEDEAGDSGADDEDLVGGG